MSAFNASDRCLSGFLSFVVGLLIAFVFMGIR